MGRCLKHVVASLEARGCRAVILSAKELAEAQQSDTLLKLFSLFRVPWLVIYWVFAFKVWRSAGRPLMVSISQEWVVPFGFSKQIAIYHDVIQYFYPRNKKSALYYRYYLRWISRKLALIYCATDATGRMVRRILGSQNYHLCGVPIEKEFLSPREESTTGERFQSVWVGTLAAHKNHMRVLNYIQSAADDEGSIAMVISAVAAPALRHEVEVRGLGDRIKIFSNLSDPELSSIYRRSATVLSTSALEGFCMPVLEAALCGCVPVVPDRATFRENFGRFGLLVPPHSAEYGNYIRRAEISFSRHEIMESAQAFHDAIRDRWSTSMDEIANAAMAGCKGKVLHQRPKCSSAAPSGPAPH